MGVLFDFRGKKWVGFLTFGEKKILPNAIYVILHLYRVYSEKKIPVQT